MSQSPRKEAMAAVEAVTVPEGWVPAQGSGAWVRCLWNPADTAILRIQAMGASNAGTILVSGYGIEARCHTRNVQAAVDLVLSWKTRGFR